MGPNLHSELVMRSHERSLDRRTGKPERVYDISDEELEVLYEQA